MTRIVWKIWWPP